MGFGSFIKAVTKVAGFFQNPIVSLITTLSNSLDIQTKNT
jgi:hypothetical protein